MFRIRRPFARNSARLANKTVESELTAGEERKQTMLAGTVVTLLVCAAALLFPGGMERAANVFSDIQISFLPQPPTSQVPVIVQVDEKSLRELGQWPWPRYQVAKLLASIAEAGASAVGVDAVFAERDRTSPVEIQRVMQRDFNLDLSLAAMPEAVRDYDQILAQTLGTGPFVLTYYFTFREYESVDCKPKSNTSALINRDHEDSSISHLYRANGVLCSIAPIQNAVVADGFNNTQPDADGVYRRTPLLIEWGGRYYPSLAVRTFMQAAKLDQFAVEAANGGFKLHMDDLTVPLDASGNLRIRFRGPSHSYDYISAADILAGKINKRRLQNKIVFVGFSATGLHEYRPIYYDPLYIGIEFHAAIVDNFLQRDFLYRPATAAPVELFMALLLGIGLTLVLAWAGPIASALIPTLVMLAVAILSQILLMRSGLVFSPVLPVLIVSVVLLTLSLLKYGREHFRAIRMMDQLMQSQEAIIESFCAMSEYRDPDTGAHIKRTQNYVKLLAQLLQNHPKFTDYLDDETIHLLYKAAPLHDIGKIGIRDYILLKPDRLLEHEFEIMKTHTEIGVRIIQSVCARMPQNRFMQIAEEIIRGHQEKWDGSGYPEHLVGDAIPIAARLMALADVYDALISHRVYKAAFSHKKAVELIMRGKGVHFDPDVVDVFLANNEQFRDIAMLFLDSDTQKETLLAD